MHRLLIVDDEELIVDGLYEIFRAASHLDLDVCKAYSGEEALGFLSRTRIDIVLTDISMPEMDGITLMGAIHENWPQCKVIFLTGYSEFEYIYQAIQHPGVSYLLKNEGTDSVIHAVEKAIATIEKELETGDLIQKAREQFQMALGYFQKDYLLRLLSADRSISISKEQFEELSIPLDASSDVLLLLCGADEMKADGGYVQGLQKQYAILQIIQRYLGGHVQMTSVTDTYGRFVLFVQPKDPAIGEQEDHHKTISYIRGMLEVIQASCRTNLGLTVSFAVGKSACVWEEVPRTYLRLSHLFNAKIGLVTEIVADEGELLLGEVDGEIVSELYSSSQTAEEIAFLETILGQKRLGQMEQYLETGQRERFFEALRELTGPLCRIKSRNNPLALEAYYTVAMYLMGFINRWRLYEKVAFHIGIKKLLYAGDFDSWEEASGYLTQLAQVLFDLKHSQQKRRSDNVIITLQEYIHAHLNEDLSLVRLSEQVYLNPSYLSRIYKKETGANLSDFIEGVRIEKAKELMKNERLRINEIAAMVGYDTATSFTRFFRKMSGLSPQEYRESLLNR